MRPDYKENETDEGCPPIREWGWKQDAIERGETEWPELPIEEEAPFPDTTHFRVVKGRYHDPDDPFGSRAYDWPPEDVHGNLYPLDWFDYTDLDKSGQLLDPELSSRQYSPLSGNLEKTSNKCNGVLTRCDVRFPEPRYCGRGYGGEYCRHHNNRNNLSHIYDNMDAEELVQTGFFAKTVDHAYEGVGPYKRVFAWGLFASLMGESTYEYAPEDHTRMVDFTHADVVPEEADEDNNVEVTVQYPTQHLDPALALFNAAVDTVKMLNVQPRLLSAENGGVMSTKETTKAQLTAPPSEHDPSPQEWKTLEETKEHPLNLPYNRLIGGREKLLKRGGVVVDPSEDEGDVNEDITIDLDVAADPEKPDKHEDYGSNETEVTKDIVANVDEETDYESE